MDAARSRARIGFMHRASGSRAGNAIDPGRAVEPMRPTDASASWQPPGDGPPKRKARKPKPPADNNAADREVEAQRTPRTALKRERIPADLASRRIFFAARIRRYRKLSGESELGVYEDISV